MKQPEITTAHLLLRKFEPEDSEAVQILASNYNVSKTTLNIAYPYESGMAAEWISTHADQWKSGKGATYAITLFETKKLIGAISLMEMDGSIAELGYWIGEPYWGNGYCSEAAQALIRFSFSNSGLEKIYAEHLQTNPASGKVMVNAGMTHQGTVKKLDRNKELVDMEMYAIENT